MSKPQFFPGASLHPSDHGAVLVLLLSLFLSCGFASAQVRINEFSAASSKTDELKDTDGDASDWLELYNEGTDPIQLQGFFLTDNPDNQKKWALPAMELAAGEFFVVFASGKDRTDPAGELHTDFQLNRAEGSYLALVKNGTGEPAVVVSVFDQYPQQRDGVTFGIASVEPLVSVAYFPTPSPGEANDGGETIVGFVADTKFSVGRGYYTEEFDVDITTATQGATIIYTTDGSFPSSENGTKVVGANGAETKATVKISTTATLRAMATKDGWAPTNVDTQTYVFAADVLLQDGSDLGGRRWGHAGVDWEMDPDVVNHEDPESRVVVDDLLSLPTIAVSLPFDDMFGDNGIYPPGPRIAPDGVERECAIEYFNSSGNPATPNDGDALQVDGTIQIVGGSSTGRWKSDNLSMRVKFAPDLNYPMFGEAGADSYDTLVLDARLNHAWHYGGGSDPVNQRGRALFVRDQLVADLQRNAGGYSPRGHHVHFYINGIYWGIRMLHERPDDNFAASYLGGDNADYDAMKHRSSTSLAGGTQNYRELMSLARKDLSDPANYQAVADIVAVDELINYMLVNFYAGNTDWAHQNWYATFNHADPNGKWRYHSWDPEHTFKSERENVVSKNDSGGPTGLHQSMLDNDEYKLRFADKVQEHFFNGGALSPEAATAAFMRLINAVNFPIRAQSARWGDNQRSSRPYTRGNEWIKERDRLLEDFFPSRAETVLGQLRSRRAFPRVDAPVFSQHGGKVDRSYALTMTTGENTNVFYTLDGSDPRVAGEPPEDVELVGENYPKKVLVPTEDMGTDWRSKTTADGFDDAAWMAGTKGAGFDTGAIEEHIDDALQLKDLMWGNNATFYLRVEFDLEAAPGPADALKLLARYDDGFVAYVNGTEVLSVNAGATEWNSNATASHRDSDAVLFEEFDITAHRSLVKAGTNLLAVQAMNVSAGGSDAFFQPMLVLAAAGGEAGIVSPTATLYTDPPPLTDTVTVNARALSNDGEWSALSKATFLVDTEPASAANLVVSEIHYRPAQPSEAELAAGYNRRTDFEFAEMMNIGTKTIDLTGVAVTNGITFDFANSAIQFLAPGERLLLVKSAGAFAMRYGTGAAARIAGEFAGGSQLSNGGEIIEIVNTSLPEGQQTVKSFAYDDVAPWPTSPDGGGFSLVLVSPETNPDHDIAQSWKASSAIGGSPGTGEGETPGGFEAWLASFGLSGVDPGSDGDNDGQGLLVEYAGGTSPLDGGSSLALSVVPDDAGEATATYLRPAGGAQGVSYVLQQSTSIQEWNDVAAAESTQPANGGVYERVSVSLGAVGNEVYIRLLIRMP